MELLIYLIVIIIMGIIWGCAANAVIRNKGYYENWFWWGFFFGIIALLVAISKPMSPDYYDSYPGEASYRFQRIAEEESRNRILNNGGWKCSCGKINASYTGTCSCGRTKSESLSRQLDEYEFHKYDALKKLKDLLDSGVITQEEFDIKKKQLF